MGFAQKLKVPKWVCRSPLANFCNGQPFRAIFGPARGQIYGKNVEKICKMRVLGPLGRFFGKNAGQNAFFCLLYRKSGFDPKVKSSKMGLSIDPRQFL